MEIDAQSPSTPFPLRAATIRDLRRHRAAAPGGADYGATVREWLPLVHGVASALVPGNPAAVEDMVVAVFQAFALRWRHLRRRTVVAAWLWRTTGFAARREARRLGAPAPEFASAVRSHLALFQQTLRLPRATLDAVMVREVLRVPGPEACRALRRREGRVTKLVRRGLAKLAKRLRRRRIAVEPRAVLAGIPLPLPPEVESRVLSRLAEWSPKQRKSDLVRALLRSWQWLRLKRALVRVAVTASVTFFVLICLAVTFVVLAQRGYLTGWFIRQQGRQMAKEMPEVLQPARPWPDPAAPASPPPVAAPVTAAELYGLTNIWSADLSFTPEQWRGIQPSCVPPVRNMMQPGGQIILRNPNARRSGLAGVVGIDFNWTEGRLEFAGVTHSNVAVRYRGNGTYLNSLYGPKQSLKVDLNKYRKGQHLAGVRTLNFVNAIPDNSYLHDALAQQVFRELGVPGPRTAYAYVTVDVPGKFARQPFGLYVLIENIDDDFARDRFGSKDVPIFKPVTTRLFESLGEDWDAYADIYDLKTKATPQQLQRVIDFARLVTSADDPTFAERLAEFLDLEEFAGFLAGHVLMASYDGFLSNGQNIYVYLDPRSNRFGFIPWDQDHGWGEFGYIASAERRERASIWQPSTHENRFLDRVLKVEAFREIYRRQLERAITDGPFTVAQLYPQIDRVAAAIRPAVAAESDFRLKRFDTAVSTNWVSRVGGAPEGPKAPVHQIKRFIVNRVASVRDQLDGKSEGEQLGRPGRR